jgi:hypothetical protein
VNQFTLLTEPVGNNNSVQLERVEYGSLLNMYVLFSLVTIPISHLVAVVRVVKSDLLVTVYVFITHVAGTIVGSSLPSCQIIGTSHGFAPASNADAVHNVGLFNKSS